MANIRIVVADRARAILYDAHSRRALPEEVARVEAPTGRLADRHVNTDKPGRHGSKMAGRHSYHIEQGPRRERTMRFVRRIARRLVEERRRGVFDTLVLMGPPRFLGTLRRQLDGPTHNLVSEVIAKDLTDAPPEVIRRQLGW
jgi:protein required for attachment to host cells